jgi:hypothetical protein
VKAKYLVFDRLITMRRQDKQSRNVCVCVCVVAVAVAAAAAAASSVVII